MIRAIALDDEPPALQVLSAFCNRVEDVELVAKFTSTEDAFTYLNKNEVDVLFLNINMPSISGIEFYKKLTKNILVIFTTAYSEFAVDAFNVHAADYLLKPFTFDRFTVAVDKVRQQMINIKQAPKEEDYLVLRIDYKLLKVNVDHILYIEGLDDYLKIRLQDQKPLVARLTMKAILEKLPADFMRVHRSYIVPFRKIDSVRNKMIMVGKEEIPLGNSYEDSFMKKFKS